MPRARNPSPAETPDALVAAVGRLSDEIQALWDVLDKFREDFSWVTRNGLPVQPIEHFVLKRMALDPCAPEWNEKLKLERSTCSIEFSASSLDAEVIDRIAANFRTAFEAVAEGQLEIVLAALDTVRDEILTALNRPREPEPMDDPIPSPEKDPISAPDTTSSRPKPPQSGRLF